MKSIWREILLSVMMAMILPGITQRWPVAERKKPDAQVVPTLPMQPGESIAQIPLEIEVRLDGGSKVTMDLEEYLVGVLLAEMPSTFAQEAKKAQAVAARTFARKAMLSGGKHDDGSICCDSGCCQAYVSPKDYLLLGGSDKAVRQAREAISDTAGLVLTYEGKLIEATYFSCSGGSTEDAVAVWGTDLPYLRSVDSPGEEHAVHYTDTVYFTKSELERKLSVTLEGSYDSWIGKVKHTDGGGVESIRIGGKAFEGKRLRSLLGLRSTNFTITADAWGVSVTTKGFGHRVGMSQYGADAMAVAGSSYAEILAHYYRGTTLELTNVAE